MQGMKMFVLEIGFNHSGFSRYALHGPGVNIRRHGFTSPLPIEVPIDVQKQNPDIVDGVEKKKKKETLRSDITQWTYLACLFRYIHLVIFQCNRDQWKVIRRDMLFLFGNILANALRSLSMSNCPSGDDDIRRQWQGQKRILGARDYRLSTNFKAEKKKKK